jgi:hypothetical protein
MAGLYPFQKKLLIDLEGMTPGEMKLITSGRKMGKSYVNDIINQFYANMELIKISWRELPGNKLQAYVDPLATTQVWGLREAHMDPIQQWSQECNCGKRMSFDMWQFKSRKHMTMFLMKWSS